MNIKRKRRLYFVLCLLLAVSVAVGSSLFALRQHIDLYYTPTQLLMQQPDALNRDIRLGGLVVKHSVAHQSRSLWVSFSLADAHRAVKVEYDGILPSLFREGQGIIAKGYLSKQGVFIADQVLAKHDANYHPPGV